MATQTKVLKVGPGEELRLQTKQDQRVIQIAIQPSDQMREKALAKRRKRGKVQEEEEGSEDEDCRKCDAEMFGAELFPGAEKWHDIQPGTNTAVFSWSGCNVKVQGEPEAEYVSKNEPMEGYANLAAILERRRMRCDDLGVSALGTGNNGDLPPRVLVTGSGSSGKSSLCELLVNYALRADRKPIFVELDPRGACERSHKMMSFPPGCIGAVVASDKPHDSGNNAISSAIMHYTGCFEWNEMKEEVFQHLVKLLGKEVDLRSKYRGKAKRKKSGNDKGVDEHLQVAHGGVIVNAPHQPSANLLVKIVESFNIDFVIVLDNEALVAQLSQKIGKTNTEIVPLPKSGGVVQVGTSQLRFLRENTLKNYFHGATEDLRPITLKLKVNDNINLFKLSYHKLDVSLLPSTSLVMHQDIEGSCHASPYTGSLQDLAHTVLAVMKTATSTMIPYATVAGLVYVKQVDENLGRITLLSPSHAPLISPNLLVGNPRDFKFAL